MSAIGVVCDRVQEAADAFERLNLAITEWERGADASVTPGSTDEGCIEEGDMSCLKEAKLNLQRIGIVGQRAFSIISDYIESTGEGEEDSTGGDAAADANPSGSPSAALDQAEKRVSQLFDQFAGSLGGCKKLMVDASHQLGDLFAAVGAFVEAGGLDGRIRESVEKKVKDGVKGNGPDDESLRKMMADIKKTYMRPVRVMPRPPAWFDLEREREMHRRTLEMFSRKQCPADTKDGSADGADPTAKEGDVGGVTSKGPETKSEGNGHSGVILRLKASKLQMVSEERANGRRDGYEWAKEGASHRQLKLLSEFRDRLNANLRDSYFITDGNQPWNGAELLALECIGLPGEHENRDEAHLFWAGVFAEEEIPSDAYAQGFFEGAMALWDEVANKI